MLAIFVRAWRRISSSDIGCRVGCGAVRASATASAQARCAAERSSSARRAAAQECDAHVTWAKKFLRLSYCTGGTLHIKRRALSQESALGEAQGVGEGSGRPCELTFNCAREPLTQALARAVSVTPASPILLCC